MPNLVSPLQGGTKFPMLGWTNAPPPQEQLPSHAPSQTQWKLLETCWGWAHIWLHCCTSRILLCYSCSDAQQHSLVHVPSQLLSDYYHPNACRLLLAQCTYWDAVLRACPTAQGVLKTVQDLSEMIFPGCARKGPTSSCAAVSDVCR